MWLFLPVFRQFVIDGPYGERCFHMTLTLGTHMSSVSDPVSTLLSYGYRYSLAALATAKHDHELAPDGRNHVHLDAAHMGLGGDDSWSPSVLEVQLGTCLTPRDLPSLSGWIVLLPPRCWVPLSALSFAKSLPDNRINCCTSATSAVLHQQGHRDRRCRLRRSTWCHRSVMPSATPSRCQPPASGQLQQRLHSVCGDIPQQGPPLTKKALDRAC